MGKIRGFFGFLESPLYRGLKIIPARVEEEKLLHPREGVFLRLVPLNLRGDELFSGYLKREWDEILSRSLKKIISVLAKRYGEDALAHYYWVRFEGGDAEVPPRLAQILDEFPPSLVERELFTYRVGWEPPKPPTPPIDWGSFPSSGEWEELDEWCARNGCTYQVVGLGTTYCCAQEYQLEIYDAETGSPVSAILSNFTYHPRDCCCCQCGCRWNEGCDCGED